MIGNAFGRLREDPSIVIIGAGFGGIGVAVRLRQAGFTRLTILERADGPGGTWWHNRYAGAEVDTPSILYSYSWMPWNWSRTHVRQAEIQDYLARVLDRFGLTQYCRFGTEVSLVEWDESQKEYSVQTSTGEVLRAKYVISAVGLLSDPSMPNLPGVDTFEGTLLHSSQWDDELDVTGKRVGIVGSGSTAVQLLPALAGDAKQATLFQREPNWVVPKSARQFTDAERWALNSRVAQRLVRLLMLFKRDRAQLGGALWRPGTPQNVAANQVARSYLEQSLAGRPDLIELVTPNHPYGGKRPVISDEFYPSLLADNVRLVPYAAREVTRQGVLDAAGDEHELDVLVMATGFKANFLTTYEVIGSDGRTIHEYWDGDERAFLGIMVPAFPNFFIVYGPNTNGGTIVTNLELQASYITAAIRRAERTRASSIEVREWAAELYDRMVQRLLQGTAFQYENNYYRSASGRVSTQWPDGVMAYAAMTKLFRGPLLKLDRGLGRGAANTSGDRP